MQAKAMFKLSVLASALALAGVVNALGLGKLTVQSSLGQPLQARIELTSASKDELDSLSAKIADPSLYRQNNLAYAAALSRARVSIERDANGQAYLNVTTAGTVNEPYLDLMVEINWASGRVVREYTFLLDPPGAGIPAPLVDPVAPVRQGSAPVRTAPAPAAEAPRPQVETKAKPGDAYTVKRGDTLSKIANETKPAAVTLEQMLVALFKSNQGAFDGNMNRLRSGSIITVPSADDAGATPATEATKIVRVQAADWRGYRDRVAAGAPEVKDAGSRAATGKIGTAVEEKTPAAPPGRDQLTVSREASPGKAAAAEQAVAGTKQLKDAQTRIADLEKTLKSLQQAVDLKNQTLAQLQAQAEATKGKAAEAPKAAPPPPAPVPAPPPAKAPEPPKAVEPPKPVEPPKVEPPKAPEAPKVEPPKAEPPKAEPPAPKATPKPAAEPSFVDDILANTSPWAIGGGALVVLGGIAALIAARRRKTTKFEDSIISGTDIKTNTVFGSTGGGVVNTGENSLATDFSREGLGNIDTDEVDPIAEAEVYLAYGRDAQAEEILKEALKKDPQRQEIHLKLLEIHAQHNKPSAFETVAAELYSVSHGQGEVWSKAVALGRELDPHNPMFAAGGTVPAAMAATAAATAAAAAVAPALIEPAAPAPAPVVEPAPVAARLGAMPEEDSGIEFRLDDGISLSPTSGAKTKSPADILAGAQSALDKTARSAAETSARTIDFVGDSGKAVAAGVAGAATAALAGTVALGTTAGDGVLPAEAKFDLDFHLDEADKPEPIRAPAMVAPAMGGAAEVAPAFARPQAAIDLEKLDLSFDPDKAMFEDPTPSVLDGQWHDAATKLDLAKAYQEMGDVEGAREILQEVMHEGDEQQKAEAQALSAKLG
jgi:pilus assembly protein FimV